MTDIGRGGARQTLIRKTNWVELTGKKNSVTPKKSVLKILKVTPEIPNAFLNFLTSK
jgi:hypothetical protein